MRVLFVSMEYPPETSYGGIGWYVAMMAGALAGRGHEVHVLSCVRGQPRRDYLEGRVQVHRRPAPMPIVLHRLMYRAGAPYRPLVRLNAAFASFREVRRLEGAFDVIEVPDWYAEGLLLALFPVTPIVLHLHGPLRVILEATGKKAGWRERAADWLERQTAQRAELITSPSRRLSDLLAEGGWSGRTPVRTVRHAIDVDKWAGVPPPSTDQVVLAVGTLQRLKGCETLIRAAGVLVHDVANLQVRFVGRSAELAPDGRPYSAYLAGLAEELGVPVLLTGALPREALAEQFAGARVVAVASYHETLSMVGLEALAAGRPLVCTSATGNAEMIAGSLAGRVVSPGDPVALADALRPYLLDQGLAVQAGRAARQIARDQASPEVVGAQLEACYREAIATFRARRGKGTEP
jgi:glycogen(starch) synthase